MTEPRQPDLMAALEASLERATGKRVRRACAEDYDEPVRGMIERGEIDPPDEFVIEETP